MTITIIVENGDGEEEISMMKFSFGFGWGHVFTDNPSGGEKGAGWGFGGI